MEVWTWLEDRFFFWELPSIGFEGVPLFQLDLNEPQKWERLAAMGKFRLGPRRPTPSCSTT